VRERVEALEGDRRGAFALGPARRSRGAVRPVARLVAGDAALAPRVEVLGSDLLDAALKERVRKRLAAWLESHVAPDARPALLALRETGAGRRARGLAVRAREGSAP
jgi:ATP-dependent RNA helicase SUPV3L1/SUV3